MKIENDRTALIGQEALDALRLMLMDDDVSDASRVSAAKALLDRFLPKEDAKLRQREADERAQALAEARCLLAEFALAKIRSPALPDSDVSTPAAPNE